MRTRFAPLLLLALAAPLGAQSFNIDVGDNLIIFPVPQNSYAGAANQTGTWNSSKFPYNTSLVALDGSATSVTTTSTSSSSYNYFPSTLTGDDYNLMVDIQNLPFIGGPWTWNFNGLQNGNYVLYTYAWAPENNGNQTRVTVPGSSNPFQDIGGFWSGGTHVLGVTYARHEFVVSGGPLMVIVEGLGNHDGSINAFQIVQTSGSGPTTYCTAKTTSSGCVPNLTSSGTPSGSAPSGFQVINPDAQPGVVGIFFYGQSGPNANPFQGGFLCVMPPLIRTPLTASGGTGPCTGVFVIDFNSYVFSGVDPSLNSGDTVWMQNWFRDPPAPFSSGLSNGITFTIGP
jgi:hypothetical protein